MNVLTANKNRFNKICSTLYQYLNPYKERAGVDIALSSKDDVHWSVVYNWELCRGKVYTIQEGSRIYFVWEPEIINLGKEDYNKSITTVKELLPISNDPVVHYVAYIIRDRFYKDYYKETYDEVTSRVGVGFNESITIDPKAFVDKILKSDLYAEMQKKIKYYDGITPELKLRDEVHKKLKTRNVIPLAWYEDSTQRINYPYRPLRYGDSLMSTKVRTEEYLGAFVDDCKSYCKACVEKTPIDKWCYFNYTSYEGKPKVHYL